MSAERRLGRKSRQRGAEPGERNDSHRQIVEIQRNFIEQTLLDLKHWSTENRGIIRSLVLTIIGISFALLILLYIHSLIKEKHNARFYHLVETYDVVKLSPPDDEREKNLKELTEQTSDLCNAIWPTGASENGCLLLALTWLELNERDKFARYLQEFSDEKNNIALSSYFTFYAAYGYESAFQLEKAYALYESLFDSYKKIKKEDISIYHRARVRYLQGNYDSARELFNQLIKDYSVSAYRTESQQYLLLIESQAAAKTK